MTPTANWPIPDLPNRLRRQADNVEGDGWAKAAWLMRHAADEIEEHRPSVPAPTPAESNAAVAVGLPTCAGKETRDTAKKPNQPNPKGEDKP